MKKGTRLAWLQRFVFAVRFCPGWGRLKVEIQEVWLHADGAIPLGLIISELTTNSCKYAFENNPSPALKISCFPDTRGGFNFEYSDNGPGFDPSVDSSSFGLKLIGLLAGQLKGEYSFSIETGSVFRLKFRENVRKGIASDSQ